MKMSIIKRINNLTSRYIMIFLFTCCIMSCGNQKQKDKSMTKDINEADLIPKRFSPGEWGYVDKNTGQFIIKPNFLAAGEFSEGLAQVRIGDFRSGKWGYIDKKGNVVIPPQFVVAGSFSEGLAMVGIGKSMIWWKCGYIDRTGNFVIQPRFDDGMSFSEGLALVFIGNQKDEFGYINGWWGYIDKTGAQIISPKFEKAENFYNGLAIVKYNGKYGVIDKSGNYVINPKFDSITGFVNGITEVSDGNRRFQIDSSGKYIDDNQKYLQNQLQTITQSTNSTLLFENFNANTAIANSVNVKDHVLELKSAEIADRQKNLFYQQKIREITDWYTSTRKQYEDDFWAKKITGTQYEDKKKELLAEKSQKEQAVKVEAEEFYKKETDRLYKEYMERKKR